MKRPLCLSLIALPAIQRVKGLDYLTDQEKAAILYDNAARFLRLSEDQIARHHGN